MTDEQKTDDLENNSGVEDENQNSQENENDDNQSNEDDKSSDQKSAEENSDENQGDNSQGKDPKEHNRKGYEIRKQVDNKDGISREEFEKLNDSVNNITEENKDLKFRNSHPEVDDDTFQTIKSLSKGSGKDYEDVLKNDPVIKGYLETNQAKSRIEGATPSPSARTSPGNTKKDWSNMSSEDFQKRKEEVMQRQGD